MAGRARRLGRPPASSSTDTRNRILDSARRCFAEFGYEASTNKVLAREAGLTTGAIYHYFGSKRDLYAAVYETVQTVVYQRFDDAAAPERTFTGKLLAVLDTALELNREDPTLAGFLERQFRADKINIAELGNMVPQLHIHVIARFESDAAWPKPVWGVAPAAPYEADALTERLAALRSAFSG